VVPNIVFDHVRICQIREPCEVIGYGHAIAAEYEVSLHSVKSDTPVRVYLALDATFACGDAQLVLLRRRAQDVSFAEVEDAQVIHQDGMTIGFTMTTDMCSCLVGALSRCPTAMNHYNHLGTSKCLHYTRFAC